LLHFVWKHCDYQAIIWKTNIALIPKGSFKLQQ